jgi:hypothetical protein
LQGKRLAWDAQLSRATLTTMLACDSRFPISDVCMTETKRRSPRNLKIDICKIAVIVLAMSVDILYSTDLRRPLAFALALVWWR